MVVGLRAVVDHVSANMQLTLAAANLAAALAPRPRRALSGEPAERFETTPRLAGQKAMASAVA
jgi:hypothetical protein